MFVKEMEGSKFSEIYRKMSVLSNFFDRINPFSVKAVFEICTDIGELFCVFVLVGLSYELNPTNKKRHIFVCFQSKFTKNAKILPANSPKKSALKIVLFYRNFVLFEIVCIIQKTELFSCFADGRTKPW
jgi:hypothetical protein